VQKFQVEIDDDLSLRITRVNEPVTSDDLAAFIEQFSGTRPYRNLIWDFAPGSLQLLSTDDLKELLTRRLDIVRQRVGGHTVMVAHDLSELTLMKWYKQFAESLNVPEVDFQIAHTVEEAMVLIKRGAQ